MINDPLTHPLFMAKKSYFYSLLISGRIAVGRDIARVP
jgi:hypothetical protein